MSVPRSKIAWTDYSGGDANIILRGHTPGDCEVSPGCQNCYAGAILRRSAKTPEHTTFSMKKLLRLAKARFEPGDAPFRRGPGSRPLVFLSDMGDLFHEAIPTTTILMIFHFLVDRPDVDWQILTKRADRMAYIAERYFWPPNAWAGVTVENQATANERIPYLLHVPAPVRFLSCEPILGPLDLRLARREPCSSTCFSHVSHPCEHCGYQAGRLPIHWVIVGGESGPKRRPFDVAWAHAIAQQCAAAGVPFFFKQIGALRPGQLGDGPAIQQFPISQTAEP